MDNLLLAAVAGLSDKVAQPREAGLNLLNELVNVSLKKYNYLYKYLFKFRNMDKK